MLFVVDANELFSAMIARSTTLDIFFHKDIELISPSFLIQEFEKYYKEIANKSGFSKEETVSFFILLLPQIKFINKKDYSLFIQRATEISPDIKDIHYFALALKFNCPIWSEEKKLKRQEYVEVLTTKNLLERIQNGI